MEPVSVDTLAAITLLPFAWAMMLVKAHHEFVEDLFVEDRCPDWAR